MKNLISRYRILLALLLTAFSGQVLSMHEPTHAPATTEPEAASDTLFNSDETKIEAFIAAFKIEPERALLSWFLSLNVANKLIPAKSL